MIFFINFHCVVCPEARVKGTGPWWTIPHRTPNRNSTLMCVARWRRWLWGQGVVPSPRSARHSTQTHRLVQCTCFTATVGKGKLFFEQEKNMCPRHLSTWMCRKNVNVGSCMSIFTFTLVCIKCTVCFGIHVSYHLLFTNNYRFTFREITVQWHLF